MVNVQVSKLYITLGVSASWRKTRVLVSNAGLKVVPYCFLGWDFNPWYVCLVFSSSFSSLVVDLAACAHMLPFGLLSGFVVQLVVLLRCDL